ncbi:MAG TPA: quinone-dependent dihydroorotate dehydrogenase [Allosphingosinicella sp.]|jgi:dihydroorotate dehydrogenase
MALYPLLRPLAFALEAERAHRLTIRALKLVPGGERAKADPVLAMSVAGLDFPNPIGLAAGFDKDAEAFDQMLGFGFGFVEVGTLTPRPQSGNPRPRLFRLAEDRAVINRMGFNNKGLDAAAARLTKRDRGRGIVGVNVGANKDSRFGHPMIADYAAGVERMAPLADYLTINISSPNTPGLRHLQDRAALEALLARVLAARPPNGPPIFLKVSPDLNYPEIDDIVRAAIDRGVDALIVSNTTVSRPELRSRHARQSGGLSGAPLKTLALERLRDFRHASGGALPLIAAGGIENGVDAWDRIRAGASLVQLYSALVYEGPSLAMRITAELKRLAALHGVSRIADAVGSEAD